MCEIWTKAAEGAEADRLHGCGLEGGASCGGEEERLLH